MSEPVWEDPPRTVGRPAVWPDRLAPLRERPGDWMNMGVHSASIAHAIKTGKVAGAEPGEFEATVRNVDPETKKATLYVRFVGSNDNAG